MGEILHQLPAITDWSFLNHRYFKRSCCLRLYQQLLPIVMWIRFHPTMSGIHPETTYTCFRCWMQIFALDYLWSEHNHEKTVFKERKLFLLLLDQLVFYYVWNTLFVGISFNWKFLNWWRQMSQIFYCSSKHGITEENSCNCGADALRVAHGAYFGGKQHHRWSVKFSF